MLKVLNGIFHFPQGEARKVAVAARIGLPWGALRLSALVLILLGGSRLLIT